MRIRTLADTLDRRAVTTIVVAAAALWAATLSLLAVTRYDGDFRAFLCLGERFEHPAALADAPRTSTYGYDGQYYAALATDPLLLEPATVRCLDAPSYRATRILVPALAHLLSLGNDRVAILLYQLLCWGLALAAIALAAAWLRAEGRSAWWALLLVVAGGIVISILRTTPDAAALALVLAALAFHRDGRHGWAVAALVAATLARETSLLVAPVLAIAELRRRRHLPAAAVLAAPLATLLAWRAWLALLPGSSYAGLGNFSLPFVWLPAKLVSLLEAGKGLNHMEFFGLLAIVATYAGAAAVLARPREIGAVEGAFLAFAALGLFLSERIYVEAFSYSRVLVALPFLAVIAAERRVDARGRWLLRSVTILYALVGLVALRGELRGAPMLGGGASRARVAALAPSPPTPAPTPAPTLAPLPPLLVLPVAHADGHDGALWRSELVLENRSPATTTIAIELLLAGHDNRKPASKAVTVRGGERLAWHDAVGELFAAEGAGALRVVRGAEDVAARGRTYNAAANAPRGRFLEGVAASAGTAPGRTARLPGLVNDLAAKARKRTHVGVLNVTAIPIDVEIALHGGEGEALGTVALRLRPFEFRQVNDVFEKAGAGKAPAGSAAVTTSTAGGAFLAYASVVRRQPPGVSYVVPEAQRQRSAGDAAASPATPPAPSS